MQTVVEADGQAPSPCTPAPFIRIPCHKHQKALVSSLWHPLIKRKYHDSLSQEEREVYNYFWHQLKLLERDSQIEKELWSAHTGEPEPIDICCPPLHLVTPRTIQQSLLRSKITPGWQRPMRGLSRPFKYASLQ